MFQPEEVALEATLDESLSGIEQLMAYSRLMAATYPSPPPHPPPRPQISTGGAEGEGEEEEKKAMYRIIPFVKKTEVPLNFPRKALEEYMDRWVGQFCLLVGLLKMCDHPCIRPPREAQSLECEHPTSQDAIPGPAW